MYYCSVFPVFSGIFTYQFCYFYHVLLFYPDFLLSNSAFSSICNLNMAGDSLELMPDLNDILFSTSAAGVPFLKNLSRKVNVLGRGGLLE